MSGRVYSIKGISPTIMGNSHGKTSGGYNAIKILVENRNLKEVIDIENFIETYPCHIKIREATKKGYNIAYEGDSINLEQPNSKTRRGRVGKQIAQTLTTSCNQAIITKNKKRKDDYVYKNNLKKYNFNMEEIKLFDSFAGIGALHKSLQKLGIPIKLVGMSEIDIDAIISYSAIYNFNKSNNLPTEEEMREYLIHRNIGYDFKTGKSKIPRLKKDKLMKCYIGSKLTNNYGDISLINTKDLPDFDLFNFSFPCTNISVAGKQEGMKKEDGSITSSGLYIYGINIIKEKKPKYIMIENVKNLISKKFIGDFNKIISQLEEIGYTCYYPAKEDKKGNKKPICLNAKNYGIPQNRERIFVICVRKDIDNGTFKFWEGKDFGTRLKDILEDSVDEKYYLNDEYQKRFSSSLNNKELQHKIPKIGVYNTDKFISTIDATTYKQPKQIIEKMFPNNKRQVKINGEIYYNPQNEYYKEIESESTTLTANGGGQGGKTGLYHLGYAIRKLTPLECWRLMGFDNEDFYKAKSQGISDSQLYKQAGNSIVVNCLYYIFKELFKDYIIQ